MQLSKSCHFSPCQLNRVGALWGWIALKREKSLSRNSENRVLMLWACCCTGLALLVALQAAPVPTMTGLVSQKALQLSPPCGLKRRQRSVSIGLPAASPLPWHGRHRAEVCESSRAGLDGSCAGESWRPGCVPGKAGCAHRLVALPVQCRISKQMRWRSRTEGEEKSSQEQPRAKLCIPAAFTVAAAGALSVSLQCGFGADTPRQPREEVFAPCVPQALRASPLGRTAGQDFRVRCVLVVGAACPEKACTQNLSWIRRAFLPPNMGADDPACPLLLRYSFVCWPQDPEVCFSLYSLP